MDQGARQEFWNHMLQRDGGAPGQISTDISDMLFKQHLWSPACWTIFPIQDVLALDDKLKAPNPKADQINVPANPKVRAQGERVWEGCVCVCVCVFVCVCVCVSSCASALTLRI